MRMTNMTVMPSESTTKPRVKSGREKFLEVGIKRFQAAFDAVESLRNIGDRRKYFYTNNEAEIMLNAIREELDEVQKIMLRRPISKIEDTIFIEWSVSHNRHLIRELRE